MATNYVKVKGKVGIYTYPAKDGKDECLYVTYNKGGKLKWEKVGWIKGDGVTILDAVALRAKRMAEMSNAPLSQNATMKEVTEKYVWYLNSEGKDISNSASFINKHINPCFGNVKLSRITPAMLLDFKSKIEASPGYRYNIMQMISRLFAFAIRMRMYTGDNPVKGGAKTKKPDTKRERFLTESEADNLIKALEKVNAKLAIQARLSLLTGMRKDEIARLHGRNINLNDRVITIEDVKDSSEGRSRHVPMCKDAFKIFQGMDLKPHELVIGGINNKAFRATVNAIGLNDGVTSGKYKVVFHTLRHTFASWLVQRGVDLFKVKDLMGHKNITMTQVYAHLAPKNMSDAINVLDGIL